MTGEHVGEHKPIGEHIGEGEPVGEHIGECVGVCDWLTYWCT
jgi:hypothetical protein